MGRKLCSIPTGKGVDKAEKAHEPDYEMTSAMRNQSAKSFVSPQRNLPTIQA